MTIEGVSSNVEELALIVDYPDVLLIASYDVVIVGAGFAGI